MITKKVILQVSLGSFAVATLLGIVAIGAASPTVPLYAGVFGLMGIGSFFVGLAFPKE